MEEDVEQKQYIAPNVDDVPVHEDEDFPVLEIGRYSLRKAHVNVLGDVSHSRLEYDIEVRQLEEDDPLLEKHGYKDITTQQHYRPGDKVVTIKWQNKEETHDKMQLYDSFFYNNPTLEERHFVRMEEKD